MGELRFFDLSETIKDNNLSIFIETGTGEGGSIESIIPYGFDKIYSIEIIKELYDKCVEKFKSIHNIQLINDTSFNGLKNILENIPSNDNILFWLDAHFPGADFNLSQYNDTKDEKLRIPLESEIELIYKYRKNSKDVFIIDDLRIYEDGPFGAGNWEDRKELGGEGIGFIEDKFSSSHIISKDYNHQGYIFLIPK